MILKAIAKIESFMRCQKGATAIEYGLIAAGIAVAISVVVFTLGGKVEGTFQSVSDALPAGGGGGGGP